jgi:hypothetical protein
MGAIHVGKEVTLEAWIFQKSISKLLKSNGEI